jgi:glutathionyl-hydroquinone reductase
VACESKSLFPRPYIWLGDLSLEKYALTLYSIRYRAGFARTQTDYEAGVVPLFAALNKLEALVAKNGGPYILGKQLTELDLRVFATVVRFDVVYVQHFKTDLGTIRHNYHVLHNWLKYVYYNVEGFKESTDFKHIKENVSVVSSSFVIRRCLGLNGNC